MLKAMQESGTQTVSKHYPLALNVLAADLLNKRTLLSPEVKYHFWGSKLNQDNENLEKEE